MYESFKVTDHIDKDKWSEFVRNHSKGIIFQTPEMMEVYKSTKRYEPIFLGVVDESNNAKAILLAYIIREFDSFLGSFSTRAIIQGGPLYEESEEGFNALKILMEHYDETAKKKTLYTEIRNRWDTSHVSNILNDMGYMYEDELNFLVDLTKSKEELWSNLSKSKRRFIRKAREKGVIIEEVKDRNNISLCYSLLQQTYKNAKIPLADISLFESAFDILTPKNLLKFFLAKYNNEYIGGIMAPMYNGVISEWYICGSRAHSKLYSSEMVTWHPIEWGSEKGYLSFDFQGAGKPDKEYGVRDFKKQFGGQLVNFGRYKKYIRRGSYGWLRRDLECGRGCIMDSIDILGLRVDNVNLVEALRIAENFILSRKAHICVTLGLDCFWKAKEDLMLYKAINSADLVTPDAMGVVWLSKILGKPLKERVTGIDLTIKLCELSAQKGYTLYLLGSTNETLAKAVKTIKNSYGSQVVGTCSPPFGPWDEVENGIIKDINEKSPDILLVATGIGKGEKWLYKNLERLNTSFCMQVGGTFNTICGNRKRAPVWMQKIGLEGIYLMLHQPWRIKRMVKGIIKILPDIVKAIISHRYPKHNR